MKRRVRTQEGFTLVELLVAGTLMGVFGLLFASAGSTFFRTMSALDLRTNNIGNAEVAEQRLISDVEAASSVSCPDTDKVAVTIGESAQTLVEYRLEGDRLLRWSLPPDKDSLVAEPVESFACNSFGPDLVELDADLGAGKEILHLAMTVTAAGDGGTGGGSGDGGKGDGGKGKDKKGKKKGDKKNKKKDKG